MKANELKSIKKKIKAERAKLLSSQDVEITLSSLFERSSLYSFPAFLEPYLAVLLEAVYEGCKRTIVHVPPQHGKTIQSLFALLLYSLLNKRKTSAYCTYGDTRTQRVLTDFTKLLDDLGVKYKRKDGDIFINPGKEECEIKFGFIDGPLLGSPINGLFILDDPYKTFGDVKSPTYNQKLDDWFANILDGRLHKGASIIVLMHRYTPTDVSARLLEKGEYDYVRLPSECDDPDDPNQGGRQLGEYLMSDEHAEAIGHQGIDYDSKKKSLGPVWNALHQGLPITDMLTNFKELEPVSTYNKDWQKVCTVYGMDLGYGGTKKHDASTLVRAERYDEVIGNQRIKHVYLTPLLRENISVNDFETKVTQVINNIPGRVHMATGGQERLGVLSQWKLQVVCENKKLGKFEYAFKYCVAWNEGLINVIDCHLARQFINEHSAFTGDPKGVDDFVDAAAKAYYAALAVPSPINKSASNGRYPRINDWQDVKIY